MVVERPGRPLAKLILGPGLSGRTLLPPAEALILGFVVVLLGEPSPSSSLPSDGAKVVVVLRPRPRTPKPGRGRVRDGLEVLLAPSSWGWSADGSVVDGLVRPTPKRDLVGFALFNGLASSFDASGSLAG